jgi:putative DNA primase/helicase
VIADLRGRRLVIVPEVGSGRKWNSQRVKNLVGERTLKGRYMRRDYFTFATSHKLWITSNHHPAVEDHSHAFWRRLRLIPFNKTFPLNPSLPGELQAELPGILAWLVEGYRRWEAEGLGEPVEVRQAVDDYRAQTDSLGLFINEACDQGEGLEVLAGELWRAYEAFCNERGLSKLSVQTFKAGLQVHGLTQRTLKGRYLWQGIDLAGAPQ